MGNTWKYMEKLMHCLFFFIHSSAHSSVIFRFQLSFATPIAKLPCLILPQAASPTQARDFWSLRLTLHWTRQTGCLATAWANSEASRYVSFAWGLETLGNSSDNVVVGAFLALNKAVLLGESPWLRWFNHPRPPDFNTLGEARRPWWNLVDLSDLFCRSTIKTIQKKNLVGMSLKWLPNDYLHFSISIPNFRLPTNGARFRNCPAFSSPSSLRRGVTSRRFPAGVGIQTKESNLGCVWSGVNVVPSGNLT